MENYLTFMVDNTSYAINVNSVLEVLNMTKPTAVPCALSYIEGLIYSREQGITVVNLRKRFSLEEHEADKRTKIIVVEVHTKHEGSENETVILYGLVADSVQDVIQIYEEELVEDAECSIPKEFISHAIRYDDKPLFILDFKKLFEEHAKLSSLTIQNL
ncbi:MAG: chemotaxis protein CheW [Treponema sp.]|nr:chemotaxis protein CheW [Treponema sp.]